MDNLGTTGTTLSLSGELSDGVGAATRLSPDSSNIERHTEK